MKDPHPDSMHLGHTWLEPEELCYPRGAITRRAKILAWIDSKKDFEYRIVRCGLPDTFFSIPAKLGRIRGFISSGEGEFEFTPEK